MQTQTTLNLESNLNCLSKEEILNITYLPTRILSDQFNCLDIV